MSFNATELEFLQIILLYIFLRINLMECLVHAFSFSQDVREILIKSGGSTLITSLERDRHLSLKEQRQMVRLLVSLLMESFGET